MMVGVGGQEGGRDRGAYEVVAFEVQGSWAWGGWVRSAPNEAIGVDGWVFGEGQW